MIFLLLLSLLACHKQIDIDEKYKIAFDYIKSSQAKNNYFNKDYSIMVSDSVVFMEISSFFDEIKIMKNKNEGFDQEQLLDSLLYYDKTNYFKTFSLRGLKNLSTSNKSKLILFFSKPVGNILMAELIYNYNSFRSYRKITTLNRSIMFLFYFDNNNNIEKVLTTEVQNE